jgi:hypothetical protein
MKTIGPSTSLQSQKLSITDDKQIDNRHFKTFHDA